MKVPGNPTTSPAEDIRTRGFVKAASDLERSKHSMFNCASPGFESLSRRYSSRKDRIPILGPFPDLRFIRSNAVESALIRRTVKTDSSPFFSFAARS